MTTPTPDDLARALNLAAERIAALTTERADLVRENEALHDVHDLLLKVEADNAALRPLLSALRRIDWMQIILNQSPPCCFIEDEDGKFCGRAERWAGHEHFHKFISLDAAIDAAMLAGKKP